MNQKPIHHLNYFFEWASESALWPADDAARARFGIPVDLSGLPLSPATLRQMANLSNWHDTSLNWSYPPDPGPWREEECARFTIAAHALLDQIRTELGPDFEVQDYFHEVHEDPELDRYLSDPEQFKRKHETTDSHSAVADHD